MTLPLRPDRPWRVLVVEDHPVNRVVAQSMLAHLGVDCALAEDGQEAVTLALPGGFDLILMDQHLPVLDGLAATQALQRGWAAAGQAPVPVVAMTAGDEALDGALCRAAGMTGFLAKPFTLEALAACLAQHLAPPVADGG